MQTKRSMIFMIAALILTIFAALKILDIPLFTSKAHAQSQEMGAYDIAVVPLEDVPEPEENVVIRSIGNPNGKFATVEVLRVIKDPRTIPVERFIYYKHPSSRLPENKNEIDPVVFEERLALYDLITHPDAARIIERFSTESPSAVAIYVKTVGDVDLSTYYFNEEETPIPFINQQVDPLYVRDPVRDYVEKNIYYRYEHDPFYAWQPWSNLAVADPSTDLNFPCMPVHSEEFPDPYVTPNTNTEFDPESYLPPQPWYSGNNYLMDEGEVREGWLLCLAPDVPVEEIELVWVYLPTYYDEFTNTPREIIWTNINVLQMGEWHLVPNQDVIGWNNAPSDRDEEPGRLDQTTVYTGDVWISIATALHYDLVPGPHDPNSDPIDIALVQFNFDGMQNLLQQWDHLALATKIQFDFCDDFSLPNCISGPRDLIEIRAQGTWVPISTSHQIVILIDIYTPEDSDSKFILPEHYYSGRFPAWVISPQDVSMPLLTTHEICEQIECIPEDVDHLDAFGDPEDHPPDFDGPIPIISLGNNAYGLQIVDLHTNNDPTLYINDLDVSLFSGIPYGGEDLFDLFVGIESNGDHENLFLFEYSGSYLQNRYGRKFTFYENSGKWPVYDHALYTWWTQIIKGDDKIYIATELPIGTSYSNFYLIITHQSGGGGPAFRIQ